jgi:hypothetical protein
MRKVIKRRIYDTELADLVLIQINALGVKVYTRLQFLYSA